MERMTGVEPADISIEWVSVNHDKVFIVAIATFLNHDEYCQLGRFR